MEKVNDQNSKNPEGTIQTQAGIENVNDQNSKNTGGYNISLKQG